MISESCGYARLARVLAGCLPLCAALSATADVRLVATDVYAAGAQVGADGAAGVDARAEAVRLATPLPPGARAEVVFRFENAGPDVLEAGRVVITEHLPEHVQLVGDSVRLVVVDPYGSAVPAAARIQYSVDGQAFAAPDQLQVGEAAGARRAAVADYRAIRWLLDEPLPAAATATVSYEVRRQ